MRITGLALSLLAVAASALAAAPVSAAPPSSGRGSVYGRAFQNLGVNVTGAGLYASWEAGSTADSSELDELARFDGATGRIEAERYLDAQLDGVLAADGWLWVTTTGPTNAVILLRLNPATLAVTRRLVLPAQWQQSSADLTVAGGWLWVAASKLLRLSLPGGQVTAEITERGAAMSTVAANEAGTVLVDGDEETANAGYGAVQRRDPRTGRLLASTPIAATTGPEIDGVIDSGIWVNELGQSLAAIQRLDLTTLRPEPLATRDPEGGNTYILGNNSIEATIADGLVWITASGGGTPANYCGDPRTGRSLAAIPYPSEYDDVALAIGTRYIYYAADRGEGSSGQYLGRIPIPARCFA